MTPEVGKIFEGKVTGISKFGAFVRLDDGNSGMVHISEISDSYVTEVKDFLEEGQQVKVKVIGIDDKGRINLSIKKAFASEKIIAEPVQKQKPALTFEEMMSKFKQESEDKLSDYKASREVRKATYSKKSK